MRQNHREQVFILRKSASNSPVYLFTGRLLNLGLLSDGSRMSCEVHVRLCVQRRLACSVGDKPTRVKVRTL